MSSSAPCPPTYDQIWWDEQIKFYTENPPTWDQVMVHVLVLAVAGEHGAVEGMLAIAAEIRLMDEQRARQFMQLQKELKKGLK